MCNEKAVDTIEEKERIIHEALLQHLIDDSSCGNCGNSCKCHQLKQELAKLGKDDFEAKAIAGELPITIQELYDKKFISMAKKM